MAKRLGMGAVVALVAAVGLASAAGVAWAGPPAIAEMRFGNEGVGSGLNDPGAGIFHDDSLHAVDQIYPRTVVISAGGEVDFDVEGFHQVAVCDGGVDRGDVSVPPFPPNLTIDDPQCPTQAPLFVDVTVQFDTPGRYLVICNITPHLAENGMYGYVIVQ